MSHSVQVDYLSQMEIQYGFELLDELIVIYQSQMSETLNEWRQSVNKLDAHKIRLDAHKLKTSARNIGAFNLGELLQSYEHSKNITFSNQSVEDVENLYLKSLEAILLWRRNREAA